MKSKKSYAFPLLVLLAVGVTAAAVWYGTSRRSGPSSPATQATTPTENFQTAPQLSVANHGGMLVNSDGRIWMWGVKNSYAIGAPIQTDLRQATRMEGIDGVVTASRTEGYALAVRHDGSVWGIGDNAAGQMGNAKSGGRGYTTEWVEIEGLRDVAQVIATREMSLVLKKDGTVWASGINEWGRLGENYVGPRSMIHVQLPHLSGIHQIGVSEWHDAFYALREDGKVLVWGSRYMLGLPFVRGSRSYIDVPQEIEGVDDVVAFADKRSSTNRLLVKRRDGSVLLWTGNGIENCAGERQAVLQIPEFQDAVWIAETHIFIFAVKADGSLWRKTFDHRENEKCEPPEQLLPAGSAAKIVAAPDFALLMQDGSVWVWGKLDGPSGPLKHGQFLEWAEREAIKGITPQPVFNRE